MIKKLKIAIYSPYLDTASGGERYMLAIAEHYANLGHQVDVLLDQHLASLELDLKTKNSQIHGLDLKLVNFITASIGPGSSLKSRNQLLKQYSYLFYLSDGSLFLSAAKFSVVHFQMPLAQLNLNNLKGWIKQRSWNLAIYNSEFTRRHIESQLKIPGKVLYPPVEVDRFKAAKKQKIILSVGRFVGHQNSKKQDILIEAFKKLIDSGKASGWSLHLAGGLMAGNESYLGQLKEIANGYPVKFYPNIDLSDLIKLYDQSSIYWHAMGYGETNPSNFEHFGISTVEAMAAGAVPVVVDKGGQTEIVESGKSGYLWHTPKELVQLTISLLSDPATIKMMAESAVARAEKFNRQQFNQHLDEIIKQS